MTSDADSALDALALIVDAVRRDAGLQTLFHELAALPDDVRQLAVARMGRDMRARRASDELVAAFELLSHPTVFAAVSAALRGGGVRG